MRWMPWGGRNGGAETTPGDRERERGVERVLSDVADGGGTPATVAWPDSTSAPEVPEVPG